MKNIKSTVRNFFAIDKNSWHYQIITDDGRHPEEATEPVVYWMLQYPLMLFAMTLCLVAAIILIAVAWFVGFSPDIKPGSIGWFLHHRMTAKGRNKLFVPWEIVFMDFVAYISAVFLFHVHLETWTVWVLVAITLPLLLITTSPTLIQKAKWGDKI